MQESTFLWYDTETFGLSPFSDRIAQFASIRTDMDLNETGEETVLYSKITPDYLPSVSACLVTGITPEETLRKGLCESDFIERVNSLFSTPLTIVSGFNNIQFDDEFIRCTLYRNLMDPYRREWANGCSRWDIIDLVRAVHDFRPDGIKFQHRLESGAPSIKLTSLTEDNGIEQVGAHDAFVDVRATIAVAKMIKERQPKLFGYFLSSRGKSESSAKLDIVGRKPVLYTSAEFTSPFGFTRPIMPLSGSANSGNYVYCFDLTEDPTPLFDEKTDIFSVKGFIRVQVNRCPCLSPMAMLKDERIRKRLNLNMDTIERNAMALKSLPPIQARVSQAEEAHAINGDQDPDTRIYADSFFSKHDRDNFDLIRRTSPSKKLSLRLNYDQDKANTMVFRHVARNWPQVLTEKEKAEWKNFCSSRMVRPLGKNPSIDIYLSSIDEKLASIGVEGRDKVTLVRLRKYGEMLKKSLLE